jgi:hypothetical protein
MLSIFFVGSAHGIHQDSENSTGGFSYLSFYTLKQEVIFRYFCSLLQVHVDPSILIEFYLAFGRIQEDEDAWEFLLT